MKRVKAAVIGCGTIGLTHAEKYARSRYGELVCVADLNETAARELAAKFDNPTVYGDYHQMLQDPAVECVSVCLPNVMHASVTIDCLEAGKHVLCEKPIAINLEQAEAMRDAAVRHKRLLAIGVVNRYNSNVNWIKEIIASGELGEIYHVHTQFRAHRSIPGLGGWFTSKKMAGGGVMIDWGIHFIDLILYVLGMPTPLTISGTANSRLGVDPGKYAYIKMWAGPPRPDGVFDVEEHASGFLRTSGPTIAFEGAWAQNIGEGAMLIDFLGDKGGIRLDYGGDFTIYSHKNGRLYKTEPTMRGEEMFQLQTDSFLRSIATGEPCPSEIESVLPTQRVLDGFYRSAKDGREVEI